MTDSPAPLAHSCAVCGLRDARALTQVRLAGGTKVTVCGTHALMHRREGGAVRTAEALRGALRDRRERARRTGEHDELAEGLALAFSTDRRGAERRTS